MRDGPQELERAGLTRIQVAGPRGASEEEARATGEGRGAFLRIRRKLLPLPPLRPCFRPRLLQDGQSTPLSSAGVSPTTGRVPKPCLLGWHRLFPVSRDHFAIQAPSAPFSTDGTILTPGRAGFMTTSLLTAIRGCDVFPAFHRQGESRSVQCLLTDQQRRVISQEGFPQGENTSYQPPPTREQTGPLYSPSVHLMCFCCIPRALSQIDFEEPEDLRARGL